MCGRFQLEVSLEELDKYYNIIEELTSSQGYKTVTQKDPEILLEAQGIKYPSEDSLVITAEQISLFKWGFPLGSKLIINSREETLSEKRIYSTLLQEKRCLIPANLFFEWRDKKRFKISCEGYSLFSIAGIFNSFVSKNGALEKRFSIITTEANDEMKDLHHRMPVIIPSDLEKSYLDPLTPINDVKAMLRPYSNGHLIISSESTAPEQLSLF